MAVWAYGVNYKTMSGFDRVDDLRHQIAEEREALQVLRVEWAYLNRPERLSRLVSLHNDRLGLVSMGPEILQEAMVIPFPDGRLEVEVPLATAGEGPPVPLGRPASLSPQ